MFSFFKRRRASRDAVAAGAPPGGVGEHATDGAHSAVPAGAAPTSGTAQPRERDRRSKLTRQRRFAAAQFGAGTAPGCFGLL